MPPAAPPPATPARRWLVTGAGGLLGRDVLATLAAGPATAGDAVTALARADLDVTDAAAVAAAVPGHDVVVHCAAWTAVDDAETHEPEAFAVNAVGAANVARACAASGARLVHVSTDYVFGEPTGAPAPWREDAPVAPRSAYGRTKAAGEWAVRALLPDRHWVLRTAWLYGEHGPSFVRTMVRLEAERDVLDVVADQTGQPTWSLDVARRAVDVVTAGVPAGTYHATSTGRTTWFGLARAVFGLLGADPERVRPTDSAAYARPASRPSWSVLGHDAWAAAGLAPLPAWEDSLHRAAATTGLLTRP
ncbi:MAG TPA: dTDP-4-dehydrorhamnose reductase [Kineosporiaceae bacterium]|nr:dTDP-4-dehydrorhamnose reductase [Kineosporiaceae bacterium]